MKIKYYNLLINYNLSSEKKKSRVHDQWKLSLNSMLVLLCFAGDAVASEKGGVNDTEEMKEVAGNMLKDKVTYLGSGGVNLSGFFDEKSFSGGFNGIGDGPVGIKFHRNGDSHEASFSASVKRIFKKYYFEKIDSKSDAFEGQSEQEKPIWRTPVNTWMMGRWKYSKQKQENVKRNFLSALSIGFDYHYDKDTVFGLMGEVDWNEEQHGALAVTSQGSGWMVSPYFIHRLKDALVINLHSGWGWANNYINLPKNKKIGFESERWKLKGRLSGNYVINHWYFNPSFGLKYFEEQQKSGIHSHDRKVDGVTERYGVMDFSPSISFNIKDSNNHQYSPKFGFEGLWKFFQPDDDFAANKDFLRAKINLGLKMQLKNKVSVSSQYVFGGVGRDNYESHASVFKIKMPLRVQFLPEGSVIQSDISTKNERMWLNENTVNDKTDFMGKIKLSFPLG